ncbi:hypothetical protein DPMN_031364 [Dreissena polymorpha]|uniref:Uncharacterized protein n=1 Tax=Dreissena polymorpha TaxID=45954 RepID=A0A9D4M0W8_DREPO|nr:hypothetical protein DPMN_031364 [Dreissena polymorpha]
MIFENIIICILYYKPDRRFLAEDVGGNSSTELYLTHLLSGKPVTFGKDQITTKNSLDKLGETGDPQEQPGPGHNWLAPLSAVFKRGQPTYNSYRLKQ